MTEFFAMLGAPLMNSRWSWGAVRPEDKTEFLRVWKDRVRELDGANFVQVTHNERHENVANDHGHQERLIHVDLIQGGAPCYLILCEAVDPKTRPRRVRKFDTSQVFQGGRMIEHKGDWWIELLLNVPVDELAPTLASETERLSGTTS